MTRRSIYIGAAVIVILLCLWFLVFNRMFFSFTIPANMTVSLVNNENGAEKTKAAADSFIYTSRSDTVIKLYKDAHLVSEQLIKPSLWPFYSVELNDPAATTDDSSLVARGKVTVIAQSPAGVLYKNNEDQSVEVASKEGIANRSGMFGLTNQTSDTKSRYVASFTKNDGTIIVVFTRMVVTIKDGNITDIASYKHLPTSHDYYRAAYDAKNDELYLLAADSPSTVYRVDGNLQKETEAYANKKIIDSIAVGKDVMLIGFTNIPNTDSSVINEYDKKYQTTPLLIDTKTKAVKKEFSGYRASSYLSLSNNGDFIGFKKRFSTELTIFDVTADKTVTIPANNPSSYAWVDNTLYFLRDNSVFAYSPSTGDTVSIVKYTGANELYSLQSDGKSLYVTSIDDTTYKLNKSSSATNQSLLTALIKKETDSAYFSLFFFDQARVVGVETYGMYRYDDALTDITPTLQEASSKTGIKTTVTENTIDRIKPYTYVEAGD